MWGGITKFQIHFRKVQSARTKITWVYHKMMCKYYRGKFLIDIFPETDIGPGLYMGHPYCIMVNPNTVIGRNCNIHKGVTIGRENRGERKGAPIIGDDVWIGANAAIVGKITIGNDVLIAPNAYVNCDVPEHSVVFGNPCVIKHRDLATEGYINNRC